MTSNVRRLDGRILELVWNGRETPADVDRANRDIAAQLSSSGAPFDLLVDMRQVVAWSQDTKNAIVDHQKYLLGLGMQRAAVVVGNAVTRMQLNNVKKVSRNDKETQWGTYEEAKAFLEA